MKVLLVEDRPIVSAAVTALLVLEGLDTCSVSTGAEALPACRTFQPDLVLLDLDLPDMTGFEVCKKIRAEFSVPVLILTARKGTHDKILAFESGADDFLSKPFEPLELRARVRALLRLPQEPTVQVDGLRIDPFRPEVEFHRQRIQLTQIEYDILRVLVSRLDEPVSRESLLDEIWGGEFSGSSRTVDMHVAKLRRKLCSDDDCPIRTVRGVGYKYSQGV